MIKISTLYEKDPNDLSKVIEGKIADDNMWVFDEGVKATRKFDGTACAIINGELYKRYDAKKGKKPPEGAIPCCEPDEITGHHPHWVRCDRNNSNDKFHFEAFDSQENLKDGTYELIGKKVQGNAEGVYGCHKLIKHGEYVYCDNDKDYILRNVENLKNFLRLNDIEGIVFHHPDGRMCKIRKKDFGYVR